VIPDRKAMAQQLLGAGRQFSPQRDSVSELIDEREAEGGSTSCDLSNCTPERLPMVDALIAAAAQSRDACLVHRDDHMAAIPADLVQQRRL
jgi:predicted nucleic acid-binding protein